MKAPTLRKAFALLVVAAAVGIGGCRKQQPPPAAPPPPPPPPTEVSEADLRTYKPNEAGAVMVVMYHHIDPKKPDGPMNRTPASFRKDLESLYERGYLPVTLREFAENRMDLPAGKTPVVLTFDDSYITQFRYLDPAGSAIDPDCAVGIMEKFSREHPDWKPKATFFVLQGAKNPPAFYQEGLVAQKFAHLLENGCEIGSHTLTHANLRKLSPKAIQKEIAGSINAIKEQCPEAEVTSLAISYGNVPRSEEARKACIEGSADGTSYRMTAIVLAAWRPTMAPIGKRGQKAPFAGQLANGDPHAIERVLPDPSQAQKAGTFEYYLKFFDENPFMRYVSDGLENVVAVPQAMASLVDQAAVKASGKKLQIYKLTPSTKQ